jgi:hypothetical protein
MDPYDVLGLGRDATHRGIRLRYMSMTKGLLTPVMRPVAQLTHMLDPSTSMCRAGPLGGSGEVVGGFSARGPRRESR